MAQTGLFKRGSCYYFRLRIPADLVSHYGKREFKFSLSSKERAECIRKVRAELARLEDEFAEVRKRQEWQVRLHELTVRRVTSLDEATMDAIAASWLEQNLAADDSLRSAGDIGAVQDEIRDTVDALRPAYAIGETRLIEPAMDQFLVLLGIELAVSAEERRRLALKFLEASLRAATVRTSRLQGDAIPTVAVVPEATRVLRPSRIAAGPALTDVLARWTKATARRPRTLMEMTSLVAGFEDYSQRKPIQEITRQDGIGFRDHMKETRKLAPATLEKNLGLLSALLNFAVDEGLLAANPFSRIKVFKPTTAPVSRLAYDEQDLAAIFSCPLYNEGERPKAGAGEAAVWLPLIAAYTGARLEEIVLLTPYDLLRDPDHGWYFSIHDLGEGKHVKTASSRRKVPVHPVLIEAGLIDYRDAVAKEPWLFPGLVPSHNGQRSGNWSKWWGRYARQVIGLSKLKCFHSFRHTFKTACRAAGVEEAVHDRLTGHAAASVGRSYGEQPLSVLRAAIDRIRYANVVVPEVWGATEQPAGDRVLQTEANSGL